MFSLFKGSFPTPEGTANIVREPPHQTENEPRLDIHIGGSEEDRQNTK